MGENPESSSVPTDRNADLMAKLGVAVEFDLPVGAIVEIMDHEHVHIGQGRFRAAPPAGVIEGRLAPGSPEAASWPERIPIQFVQHEAVPVESGHRIALLDWQDNAVPDWLHEKLAKWAVQQTPVGL